MSETTEQVRALLHSRLEEIHAEAERLKRALESLTGAPANGRSFASLRGVSRTADHRPRGRRAARGERQAQLLAMLERSPGATSAELARAIGVAHSQASVLVAKAKSQGLIVRQGSGYALKAG
jgi:predicted HTH transcriptional regulator